MQKSVVWVGAFGGRPYWWFISRVLSVDTPIGRKMRSTALHHGTPLIRTRHADIVGAGIDCTPRVSGTQSGQPQIEDGRTLAVEGVVWATAFRPDFNWIRLPVFDEHGYPRHRRGVVQGAPGLYFVGLHFQSALGSSLLGGVGADAGYIAKHIARWLEPSRDFACHAATIGCDVRRMRRYKFCETLSIGSHTVKVDPWPSVLSTCI